MPRLLPDGTRPHPPPPELSRGPMRGPRSTRYQPRFPAVVPVRGEGRSRVTHPFATLYAAEAALTVRLACVRHAASVHPEPGSNSSFGRPLEGRLSSNQNKEKAIGMMVRGPGSGPSWNWSLVGDLRRLHAGGAPHAFLSVFLGIRFSRFPGRLAPRPAASFRPRRKEIYYAHPLPRSRGFPAFFPKRGASWAVLAVRPGATCFDVLLSPAHIPSISPGKALGGKNATLHLGALRRRGAPRRRGLRRRGIPSALRRRPLLCKEAERLSLRPASQIDR